jgi:hypothetical protein
MEIAARIGREWRNETQRQHVADREWITPRQQRDEDRA